MSGSKSRGLRISDLSEDDRPRERLMLHGASALSNSELLAILIGSGTTESSAIELAQRLLQRAQNDLGVLGRFSLSDFKQEKGIGDAKAVTLLAALELGRRRRESVSQQPPAIRNPRDIYELLGDQLRDLRHEEMWVIYLNRANRVIRMQLHSRGGSSGTVVDSKAVTREALECHAEAVALCHNHPSGNSKPSAKDVAITSQLETALGYFGIILLDHVVIGGHEYSSIRSESVR